MTIDVALISELTAFRQGFKTVILASSHNDQPTASYTPYIEDEKPNFYIFISNLAQHTNNISHNPLLDLLWIENEDTAKNLFTRKRLQITCHATKIESQSVKWQQILQTMQENLGGTIKILRTLPDFNLLKLTPLHANYVQGFANAYNLSADNLSGKIT